MKKTKNEPRLPSKFWTGVPKFFAWPFIKLRNNIHVDKSDIKDIKKPFILICNHATFNDPVYIYCALFPFRINFVGGYAYFKNPFLNWYIRKLGSIPKFQYQTDLNAMRSMMSVIKRNGVLGIFPTGRLPSVCDNIMIPDSMAKLIKLCKADVVVAKSDGAYLTKPKWSINHRRGRIDIKFTKLFNKEDIHNISVEDMTKMINEALYYNDYEWNKDKQIKFGKKNLAVNLESILYKCPNCNKDYVMSSKNNTLFCKECGCEFEYLPTGYFKENKYFNTPLDYFEWQRKDIQELIKDKNFVVEDDTDVIVTDIHTINELYGKGKVKIDYENIEFNGVVNNEERHVVFSLKEMFSLPYKANTNFEIADNNDIYKFNLVNGKLAAKFSLIVEELYKVKNPNIEK